MWRGRLRPTWNEVQGEVHDVADQGLGAKSIKGALEDLAQTLNRVTARLELAALGNNPGAVARDESAVKRVEEGVLEQKVPGDDRDERRALVEDEKGSGESGQRAIDKDENGELGQIGEGKHEAHDADRQTDSRQELRKQGLPQGLVG